MAADKPNPTKTNLNLDVEISPNNRYISQQYRVHKCFFASFLFRPLSTSGLNAMSPGTTQFAILYNGSMCVYDGIPAEKVNTTC